MKQPEAGGRYTAKSTSIEDLVKINQQVGKFSEADIHQGLLTTIIP